MTDTATSQSTDPSSWITMYMQQSTPSEACSRSVSHGTQRFITVFTHIPPYLLTQFQHALFNVWDSTT